MRKIIEKKVFNFLNEEYKDYASYVIESRAISSCIDGFKPTQRKIIYALKKYAGGDKVKVNVLTGLVIANCQYHHGDVSCSDSVINMAQKFKNNLPLLEDIGIYGSLRNPFASSPRYVATKLSKNYHLIYKDEELLENSIIDGYVCEYKHYLPIIPMILINGSDGIAIGFAMKIINRNPIDVINACINCLNGKKINDISPKINEFNGLFILDKENPKKWIIRGIANRINTTTVDVVELPPSMTYEKYEKILDDLQEDKTISSYQNNSKDNIKYTIRFTRESLSKLNDEALIKLLKLEEYKTEIFTTLDENGKLKIFESAEEIISYFVNFRLSYYQKRKDHLLNKLSKEKSILANKGKFIKLILDNKLEIKKKKKDDLILELEKMEFAKYEDGYDYLLRMPLWSLTSELFEKLKQDFSNLKDEIKVVESSDPRSIYLEELLDLKQKISKK